MSRSLFRSLFRAIGRIAGLVVLIVAFVVGADGQRPFGPAERVAIVGYGGEAMEPFLTRDGRYLFFNNLNEKNVNTNLHWAERVDDLHFLYRGEIAGVNTPALEGVASMDLEGKFYFVSNRSYDTTASTLYRGRFHDGMISGVELVPGVSLAKPGIVNFDAEISGDGGTLYFVESQFSWRGQPKSARILMARREGSGFARDAGSEAVFRTVNAQGLNYAPAISASELEIFFTRSDPKVDGGRPGIYVASRERVTDAFGTVARVAAITGFSEGPTVSPDENAIYFHKKGENGRFAIFRTARR